jgi:hypothetical protein
MIRIRLTVCLSSREDVLFDMLAVLKVLTRLLALFCECIRIYPIKS